MTDILLQITEIVRVSLVWFVMPRHGAMVFQRTLASL